MTEPLCWIFDFDGTLLDDVPPMRQYFTKDLPAQYNLVMTEEQIESMEKITNEIISGKISKLDIFKGIVRYHKEALNQPIWRIFKFLKKLKTELGEVLINSPLFPNIVESLERLKFEKHDIIAVNTSSSLAELKMKFRGKDNEKEFFALFEELVFHRDNLEKIKPHPDAIYKICKIKNIKPSQCIMIGDMIGDIEAGKNAGATTVAVLCGVLTRDAIENLELNPDFIFENAVEVIEHYDEIAAFVQKK